MATISGEIRDENNDLLADAVVRAYRRDTGALMASGLSGDGSPEEVGDAYYNDIVLLLHFNGTDGSTTFTDTGPTPKTLTANGGAHIEADQSKFGGTSGAFDGAGDNVSVPTSTDFYFPGDFTFEAWIYMTAQRNYPAICGNWDSGINYPFMFATNSGGNLQIFCAGTLILTSSGTIALNTWTHAACVRNGTTITLYLDGVAQGTATYATAIGPSGGMPIWVGDSLNNSASAWQGYLDEVRLTKGVARYTAAFTPPAAAFVDLAYYPARPLGQYSFTTAYTGEVNVIALDPDGGTTFNDLILRTTPV